MPEASLATAMLAGDEELISYARWEFRADCSVGRIKFAAGVIFKSAKNLSGDETGGVRHVGRMTETEA